MIQSTEESRDQIITLLYRLGIITQLRRTVEMIKSGLVKVYKEDSKFTFSHTQEANHQFLDELEVVALDAMEKKLKSSF